MESNKTKACPCKRTACERHGDCAACKEHHHSSCGRYPLATCERLAAKKKNAGKKGGNVPIFTEP